MTAPTIPRYAPGYPKPLPKQSAADKRAAARIARQVDRERNKPGWWEIELRSYALAPGYWIPVLYSPGKPAQPEPWTKKKKARSKRPQKDDATG